MSFFQEDQTAKLAQIARDAANATDLHQFVAKVVKYLRGCGFYSARYYECALNRPENDELLILAAQETPAPAAPLGYEIRFKASTLGLAADHDTPAVSSSNKSNQKWVGDLGLSDGCHWVDVPVRARNRLIGLIAADWRGEETRLVPADKAILGVIGSLVANLSEAISAADADRVAQAFMDALTKNSDNVEDALNIAATELVETMNFAAVAVFERSQGGGYLRKIRERVHPRIGRDITPFPEEYKIGEYLTGIAWQREDVRHVVNFAAQVENKGYEVERTSFDRHTSLLGGIKSALYSKIESSEPRYLVRIMNCVASPLPIVAAQRKVVDHITKSIAGHIDDVIAKRRLGHVIGLARVASRNITKPREVIAHAREAMRHEGFDDLVVIARHRDQDVGAAWLDVPGGFKAKADEVIDWSDKTFRLLLDDKLTVSPIQSLIDGSPHSLFHWLKAQGFQSLVSKSIQASQIDLVLGLPLKESAHVQPQRNGTLLTGQLIDTYGSIICSSIEGYDSHVTVEGSRRFMGRIGHEVRAPALDSAQAAVHGLAMAQRVLPHIQDEHVAGELRAAIHEALLIVNRKSTEIDRMMDFAKLAALEEVGNVPFNFQHLDLGELLNETIETLRNQEELVTVDKLGKARPCIVVLNKAVAALGSVTGDAAYLRVIFSHLLRNAAKYSLPRGGGKAPEIKITGIPQAQMAIVQISNWGVGIDESEFETIFRPHVRGTAHDKRKAIAGLGLGLYVSRLLVKAHGGTVFCHHSTPTLNDSSRKAAFEGFETCFEVRLPRERKTGVMEIELGGRVHDRLRNSHD